MASLPSQEILLSNTNTTLTPGFLRLNPNGRIPTLVDNSKNPPFPVIETSAQLLYLLKEYDPEDAFGFKDEFERNEALQWMFFWRTLPSYTPPYPPPDLSH